MPLPPVAAPDDIAEAVKVWNFLGGLEWQGLDVAVEIFGVQDVERLIIGLVNIRDVAAQKQK